MVRPQACERVPFDDGREFRSRLDDDRYAEAEASAQGVRDRLGVGGWAALGVSEDGVAAVEERLNVSVAELLQEEAKLGHRHSFCLADIDSAQEGDKGGHCGA